MTAFDPSLARRAAEALFVLTEAERMGVRFKFGLEADYPSTLSRSCIDDLERAIGTNAPAITRILMLRIEAREAAA